MGTLASMKKQPSLRTLEKRCADFNSANPIGTKVLVKRDDGNNLITVTRSAAYVLSGHTAVIFVEGISGCYDLSRVDPVLLQFSREGGKLTTVFERGSKES